MCSFPRSCSNLSANNGFQRISSELDAKNVDEYQEVEGALKIIVRFPGLLSGIRGITKKIMIGRKNDIKTNDSRDPRGVASHVEGNPGSKQLKQMDSFCSHLLDDLVEVLHT